MTWFSRSTTKTHDPKVYNDNFEITGVPFKSLHAETSVAAYTTMFFIGGKRLKANVCGYGSVLIYDIDEGYTGNELKMATEGYERLIVTTMSHTDKKPRMRILFKLSKRIPDGTNEATYKALMTFTAKIVGLNTIDENCLDLARQYAPNPNQQHFYFEGETLNLDLLLDAAIRQVARDEKKHAAIQKQKYELTRTKFIGSDKTKADWYRENLNTQVMYDKLGFDDKAGSGRNSALNQIGFYLLSGVGLQPMEVASAVMYVNSMYSDPLPEHEIERTIFRSLKIGGTF